MEFYQFLDKNSATIIAVSGTIIGVIITQFFNWLNKSNDWQNQVKLKKLDNSIEFEKQNIIYPIKEFMETEIILLQKIYAKGMTEGNATLDDIKDTEHIKNLSVISAKIKSYKNQELNKKFEDFKNKRFGIQKGFSDNDLKKADNNFIEAENLYSEILHIFTFKELELSKKPWWKI